MRYIEVTMNEVKYWMPNCALLNDEEFDEFVEDIEQFVQTREDRGKLPQKESEQWLNHFIEDYAHWRGRKFTQNRYPLRAYFQIDTRTGSIETLRRFNK